MDANTLRPYLTYSTLRAAGDVVWTGRTWLVTSFADADAALAHPDLSAKRVELLFPNETVPESAAHLASVLRRWIFFNDPGEVKNDRKLVWELLGPKKFETLPDLLAKRVTELVAQWDPNSVDLLTCLATPTRVAVTSHMLDIPECAAADLIRIADPIFDFITASSRTHDQLDLAVVSMTHLCQRLEEIPLIKSLLLPSPDQFSAISQLSLLVTVTVFIEKAVANSLYVLLGDTARWAELTGTPDQLGLYIHEALRLESPTQITSRIAQNELVLGGQTIRKGQPVAILIGSANRDERVFENPTQFNPHRTASRTLTFGNGGKRCPGEWLSNMVVASVLRSLISADQTLLKHGVLSGKWSDNMESRRLTRLIIAV